MKTASLTYHLIQGSVLLVIMVGFVGWVFFRALKRSEGATRQKAFSLGISLDSRS